MPKEKQYHTRKFSPTRMILADYNVVAASLHRVCGLIEIDITDALAEIAAIKKIENYNVSMTSWIAKCVAQVVIENKQLNTYRKRRKLIVFDTVDISVIVERTSKSGKKIPYNHVLRSVENKSVREITDEIRAVQNDEEGDVDKEHTRGQSAYMTFYPLLPRFVRRFVIRQMICHPFRLKKLIGTVGITSLGMFMKGQGGWAVPFADKTLNIAIGGIKDHAVILNGSLAERKLLCVTFLIDHDIVDGGPATRLASRLSELLGDTSYLENLDKV